MAEITTVTDPDGCTLMLAEVDGKFVSPATGIRQRVKDQKAFKGRDDDILILAYPKSGTHWTWEIAHMLHRNSAEHIVGEKGESFFEFIDVPVLDGQKSPRMLNTHFYPDFIPEDLIRRKCKIIYIQRNPKDVFVSLYNHCKNLCAYYKYTGKFSGFFELALAGQVETGSWFDYSIAYEDFFKKHPDIPVLRLHYEDMKEDLLSNVRAIAEFCNFSVSEDTMKAIAEACTFSSMKKFKVETVSAERRERWQGGTYNMYRKGVAGDWKNWFTVAQNERFDGESQKRLAGSNVTVKWVN